ncbi:MAG: hypothetical protein ABR529_07505 [Actinomycetota bacterium]
MSLRNTDIAELLARAADAVEGHRARAYRTAARAALMWGEEIADVIGQGRSPAELERVGPSLARRIGAWIEEDVPVPDAPPARRGFLSYAEARSLLASDRSLEGLRGDLQMHTVLSDGKATLEEMASTGAGHGYEYVAITDHSKGLKIAGGIDEEMLAHQRAHIDAFNRELADDGVAFTVLRSLEMNLDEEGNGDMEPSALTKLDIVLGSFHSALRRTEDRTPRFLAALRNPFVHVIGHPRGRKFNLRTGLNADWAEVAEAAAAAGKALEVNAYPDREDLSVDILELVRDAGGWISIGTDAHDPSEMRFVDIGVASALRAGIPRARILNFLSRDELVAWAARTTPAC